MREGHVHDRLARADDEPQGLRERQVAHVGRGAKRGAVRMLVAHRGRIDARAVGHGGLEERAVEFQEPVALARGALREEPDALALCERVVHQRVDARGVVAARAADEDRPRFLRQPARQRPVADLALGDEARVAQRGDGEDVRPGDVVGGDHRAVAAVRRRAALAADADRQDPQEVLRPAHGDVVAPLRVGPRPHEAQREERGAQVQE